MKNFFKAYKFFFIIILSLYKQFICKRQVTQCIRNVPKRTNFFLQKCSAYLRAALKTIVIPLSTVFTRISTAALIKSPCGAYLSNYCNLQLKSLLHLGQNVITFRTLLHLGLLHTYPYSNRICPSTRIRIHSQFVN